MMTMLPVLQECTSIGNPDPAWQQAQLSLSRDGLGHCCFMLPSQHLTVSSSKTNHHLVHSIQHYNCLILLAATIPVEATLLSPGHQKDLSS